MNLDKLNYLSNIDIFPIGASKLTYEVREAFCQRAGV